MNTGALVRQLNRAANKLVALTERPRYDDVMWWTAVAERCSEITTAFYEGMTGKSIAEHRQRAAKDRRRGSLALYEGAADRRIGPRRALDHQEEPKP